MSRHQLWIGTIGKPVRILSRGLGALASGIIIIICGRTSVHTLIVILSFIIINILCLTLVLVYVQHVRWSILSNRFVHLQLTIGGV